MPARSPFFIDIGASKVVQLQLVPGAYNATLLTTLGIASAGATGEVPTGKILVGKGKAAALANGCFGVNAVYAVGSAGKTQTAKLLCSPTKADTVFNTIKGNTYNGKNIIEARPPRRRVLTF